MLEKYEDKAITVKLNDDDNFDEKNKKRINAIKDQFVKTYSLPKEKAKEFVNDEKLQAIKDIDFSKANPRNNGFMNEISFIGQGVAEGFLEVFNIEVDKAVDKYMKKNHIIEQQKKDGTKKAFIGTFNNNKLKRLSDYFEDSQSLNKEMKRQTDKKQQIEGQQKKQSKKQEQTLSLQRNKEE